MRNHKRNAGITVTVLCTAFMLTLLVGCGETAEKPNQTATAETTQSSQTQQPTKEAEPAVSLDQMSLTQPIGTVSFNTDENNQALQVKYGLSIDEVNQLAKSAKSSGASDHSIEFTLSDASQSEGENYYTATGIIRLNGVEDSFFIGGTLKEVKLSSGDVCYAGGLHGYLNGDEAGDSENAISLSVNYDSTTGDCLITATVGTSIMLDFGTPFDGISEISQQLRNNEG